MKEKCRIFTSREFVGDFASWGFASARGKMRSSFNRKCVYSSHTLCVGSIRLMVKWEPPIQVTLGVGTLSPLGL